MEARKLARAFTKLFGRYANAVRSGVTVYVFSTVGLFSMALVGWVGQVGEWSSAHGAQPFPSTSVLGYAFVSALTAGGPALLAVLVRGVQTAAGIGNPPQYAGQPASATTPAAPEEPKHDG